jgi:glycosyltransferase involved in cell wall biosynthesis
MLGQRAEMAPLLHAADVLMHPTYSEGMPLAVIEAMAAGLPVVGSDIPPMREVLGGTGVLVPDPRLDRRHTATCVVEALNDLWVNRDERLRLGQQGRSFAQEHYRASTMMDRYEKILTDVSP